MVPFIFVALAVFIFRDYWGKPLGEIPLGVAITCGFLLIAPFIFALEKRGNRDDEDDG